MWLLHSYSLMPSWSTEDVVEMASMHAEAMRLISALLQEPHNMLPISAPLLFCADSREKVIKSLGLCVLFFVNPDQSTCRLSVSCSLCV